MEAVNLAMSKVNPIDCAGWFRHAKRFIPQCISSRPIETQVDDENCNFDMDIDSEISDYDEDSVDEIVALNSQSKSLVSFDS